MQARIEREVSSRDVLPREVSSRDVLPLHTCMDAWCCVFSQAIRAWEEEYAAAKDERAEALKRSASDGDRLAMPSGPTTGGGMDMYPVDDLGVAGEGSGFAQHIHIRYLSGLTAGGGIQMYPIDDLGAAGGPCLLQCPCCPSWC